MSAPGPQVKGFLNVTILGSLVVGALMGPSSAADRAATRTFDADAGMKSRVQNVHSRFPITFEKNNGQTDSRVEYLSRGPGYTLFLLHGGEAVLALAGATSPANGSPVRLRLQLVNANETSRAVGRELLPGTVNYLRGNDSGRWQTGIPTFSRVAYENAYPGIDLVYHSHEQQLEYDFIVRPGADPTAIMFEVEGADRIELDGQGDLVMHVGTHQVRHKKPLVYQEVHGRRRVIDGAYKLRGSRRIQFQLGEFDPNRELVVDPILTFSSFLGGSGQEDAQAVATDVNGNIYVAGGTQTPDFPTFVSHSIGSAGSQEGYVAKLNAIGQPVFVTYLGGTAADTITDVEVDGSERIFVIGNTSSTDFPVLGGPQLIHGGGLDAFAAGIQATGAALDFSTFIGGGASDFAMGLQVDAGFITVAGGTTSTNFPVTPGAFQTILNGPADAFVMRLSTAGPIAVQYSTLIGGSAVDVSEAPLDTDASGASYVVGRTTSSNFPVTAGAVQPAFGGGEDVFLAKFSAAGARVYATYVGGSATENPTGVTVDGSGNAYVTGFTGSSNYPVVSALQPAYGGANDAFLTVVNSGGGAYVFSTFLGGSGFDGAAGIALDPSGDILIAGVTFSSNYPLLNAFQTVNQGSGDVFVTRVSSTGSSLVYSSYLGGSGQDGAQDVIATSGGTVVVGTTRSANFPTVTPPFATLNGLSDAFVARISEVPVNSPPTLTVNLAAVSVAEGQTATNGGSYSDNNAGDNVMISASVGSVIKSGTNSGNWSWSLGTTNGPAQSQPVTITANDGNGGVSTSSFSLTVTNVAPVIQSVTGPIGPLPLGTATSVSADFSDAGTQDTHTCTFSWDDGSVTPPALPAAVVTETAGSGSCTATHTYAAAGVYSVEVTVTDSDQASAMQVHEFVVIYDPSAGFVTGGGWITSPAGALTVDPSLTGKATFGFISKYNQGAKTPSGQTEFQFRVAGFNFHSVTYEWLVVAGAKAQYKGTGTINNTGNYSFLLTATDGALPGGGGEDKFRIKIWDAMGVVYDNVGGLDDIDQSATQVIGGGSIVIHGQ